MRKTTLFLLSSVSILAACYTSPEMNEGRYEDMYIEDESACRYNDDMYQHKGLRRCLEDKAAYESANKKTVRIIQQKDGTALVVPRTYDDSLMTEQNRVYQVVERDSNTVFVDTKAEVSEDEIEKMPEPDNLEDSHSPEPPLVVEEDIDETMLNQEDRHVDETGEISSVQKRNSAAAIAQDDDLPTVQIVVEAENPAPPQVVPVVEEISEDEECCEEDCCEEEVETSSEGKDLTFVMQPSDDELIISIKSKKKCPACSEETCPCKQKKVKKIETFKKNEKEYLPLEEK